MSITHLLVSRPGSRQYYTHHNRLIFKVSHNWHGLDVLYYCTDIQQDNEIRHAHMEIAQLREAFYIHRKDPTALLLLSIVFERDPNSVEDPPCALAWKNSSLIMLHHNSTQKLMETVIAVSSRGDNMVLQAKNDLITELRGYLDHLDKLIADRWQQRKQVLGMLPGVAQETFKTNHPFIHQNCERQYCIVQHVSEIFLSMPL